ncbi:MAG: LysM peptidoglycan-binding domain-containing protein [Bacteroidota bacterium]|nr:LysM peptidoglycan-binding domain-containing protein [Bacteroidota bacterium]
MRSILNFLLVISFMISLQIPAVAQTSAEVKVEISKETTLVDGKSYYLHTVKKGENLYRISQAYKVSHKDVVMANPEVAKGVKEGQVLKIPGAPSAPRSINQIKSGKYIYHVVEEKQTLFSILQKYKISKEELIKYNPELEYSALQVGQVVKIPKNSTETATPAKQEVQYTEYKVTRKDTKYSISQQFNISVDDLIGANPVLNTDDIKVGQTLKIPLKNKPDTTKYDSLKEQVKKSVSASQVMKKISTESFNVAFLMPLFLEDNASLTLPDSTGAEKQNLENSELFQRTSNVVEFYQGALLALDSLKKAGVSVKVYAFDTGKDPQKLAAILVRPEMAKMDLIIGPFHTEAVDKTALFAQKHQIKMVSPVSANARALRDNPYIYQINPGESAGVDVMMKYVSKLPNKNVIFVTDNIASDKANIDLFRSRLNACYPNKSKTFNYINSKSQISSYLVKGVDNIIILPSEQEAVVSMIFAQLTIAQKGYSIQVFGSQACTMFRNIDQENLHSFQFHYFSAFYADFYNQETKNFLTKFKANYNIEPYFHNRNNYPYYFSQEGYNYGFLGYDITFYFLNALALGKDPAKLSDLKKIDLLHTNIDFERERAGNGFLNKGINILKYSKDYKLVKVN